MYPATQHATDETCFVGESAFTRSLPGLLRKYSVSSLHLLVTGETGTGKSIIAEMANSFRNGKMVKISCPNIPETLFESELFGTGKAAYTGAADRQGYITGEERQTVWFDEIGETALTFQAKLLVLFDGDFRRLGGNHTDKFSSKVICTTNVDLEQAAKEGLFRGDLLARIRQITLNIPPLRQRPEDIMPLVRHFFRSIKPEGTLEEVTASVWKLQEHPWPGNGRDVHSAVANAAIQTDSSTITTDEILHFVRKAEDNCEPKVPPLETPEPGQLFPLGIDSFEGIEKLYIERALRLSKGNQAAAARKLDFGRDALRYKMKKYDLL